MTIPADDAAVVVDTAGSRFVLGEGGSEAELIYVIDGDRLLLVHTEVPSAWGGHGIGGRLVRAALAGPGRSPDRGALVPVRPPLAAGAPRGRGDGHHRLGDATPTVLSPCTGISQGVVLVAGPGTFDGFDGEDATQ